MLSIVEELGLKSEFGRVPAEALDGPDAEALRK
jgi:hypothetical protein